MTPKVITDEQLFDTLHWLEDNARKAAQAKATRVYLEEWMSHVRAKIAQECIDKEGCSAAAADVKAKASDAYRDVVIAYREAVEEDAFYSWHRTHSDAIVSAYQTLSANRRAIEKAL